MNSVKNQAGFTLTAYLLVTLLIVVGVGGFFLYQERKGMMEKIETQGGVIASQKVAIEGLETENERLSHENNTLNKQIEVLTKINEDNDKERTLREKRIRELEDTAKRLSYKLPSVLPDLQVGKATDFELKNSQMRIEYIWNIYQIDYTNINQGLAAKLPSAISVKEK